MKKTLQLTLAWALAAPAWAPNAFAQDSAVHGYSVARHLAVTLGPTFNVVTPCTF